MCDSFGAAWNLATCPTACITSGQEAITYRRLPIINLYNLWSTSLDESSMLNLQPVTIGIRRGLQSSILNFLSISLMYLAWHINIPFSCWDIWSLKKYVSSPSKDISNSLCIFVENFLLSRSSLHQILYHPHIPQQLLKYLYLFVHKDCYQQYLSWTLVDVDIHQDEHTMLWEPAWDHIEPSLTCRHSLLFVIVENLQVVRCKLLLLIIHS